MISYYFHLAATNYTKNISLKKYEVHSRDNKLNTNNHTYNLINKLCTYRHNHIQSF